MMQEVLPKGGIGVVLKTSYEPDTFGCSIVRFCHKHSPAYCAGLKGLQSDMIDVAVTVALELLSMRGISIVALQRHPQFSTEKAVEDSSSQCILGNLLVRASRRCDYGD